MSDFQELLRLHHEHAEQAAKKGQLGRAGTAPAVSPQHLDRYVPMFQSLDPMTKIVVQQLVEIVRGTTQVPLRSDLDKLDGMLNAIPDGEVRNAVFHVFWHCKELACGRTPQ